VARVLELSLSRYVVAATVMLALASCSVAPPQPVATLQRQVADTERAFAKTMATRDYAAFTTYISDEAIFFTGSTPLRGKLGPRARSHRQAHCNVHVDLAAGVARRVAHHFR